ncbi:GWxTD domain-containing protein [Rhodocaloribacter sp.]
MSGRSMHAGVRWALALCLCGAAAVRPAFPQASGLRADEALVREAFEAGRAASPEAARAYRRLLAALDGPLAADEAALLRPYLEALSFVAPPEVRSATGLRTLDAEDGPRLAPGAGARLLAWWRSRDPAPATEANEALLAHLERLAHALRRYHTAGGFDDRGRVYIRLGPPAHITTIDFNTTDFREKVLRVNLTLQSGDFPENEFWVYDHVDRAAQFLFVKKRGAFRLGEVGDLVPPALRNAVAPSVRGRKKGEAVVRVMEEIYRNLSLHHPGYAARYADVAGYVDRLDAFAMAGLEAEIRRRVTGNAQGQAVNDGASSSAKELLGARARQNAEARLRLPVPPNEFARSALSRAVVEDRMAARTRERYVPRTFVDVMGEAEPFPVFVRTARFLDPDGTTRTEVYWGTAPESLTPTKAMRKRLEEEGFRPPYDFLLLGTLVQSGGDYERRAAREQRLVLRSVAEDGAQAIPAQTYVARGDTGWYHLAVQWDLYAAAPGAEGGIRAGPRLRTNVFRADSLHALDADEGRLEMSDLKPMRAPVADPSALVGTDAPYPYTRLAATLSPALYFEVYHLTFGADDHAHFTVEYEVTRNREKGGFLRLKKGDETRTVVRAPYTADARTAREFIYLDLSAWEGEGVLDVRVRVTDEVSGRRVERALRFALSEED